ncbi:MAG: triple tyrosine motif-containing protein, partial [Ferruginibacter sp.]
FANGRFNTISTLPEFNESSRFVAIDNNDQIWVSHPYHGIYRITKKSNGAYTSQTYTEKEGLPSTLNNHVYKIKNEVLAATEKGIYIFNQTKNIFEPADYYQRILGAQSIRYMKEDKSGNIWFIHEKTLGVVDFSGKEPALIYLPELNNKMLSGFEFIYPVNDNNIFLGGERGFFHINYEKYKSTATKFQVQLRVVTITNKTDSLIFGGYFKDVNEKQIQEIKDIPQLNHHWRTIHLEYSSSLFGYQSILEYSYRLRGFDKNWSDWSKRAEKDYTNLPTGEYTFEVKAKNNLGNESEIASYSFTILPPWYETTWAKIIYLLLFVSAIYALYRWQKNKFLLQQEKHEEEQKRLLYIHELERNKTETEMVALGNEKLEAEINFKNSELASSAMHLVKKGELISKIKGEIVHVIKGLDNPLVTAELKKMIKAVSEDDNMDKEWENFTKHFDKVQSDFLVELKEKHPSITGNELKLCAYLRMNLSTKEIAQLMNISVRGVEISRYRLRKKLQVATETSLFDYLIKIQTKP